MITVPLLGDVPAAGRAPSQLASSLVGGLERFVEKPRVTVSVTQATSARIYVVGQMVRPGEFPLSGRMTVLKALALAGGFKEFARSDSIVIVREDQTVIPFNYKRVADGQGRVAERPARRRRHDRRAMSEERHDWTTDVRTPVPRRSRGLGRGRVPLDARSATSSTRRCGGPSWCSCPGRRSCSCRRGRSLVLPKKYMSSALVLVESEKVPGVLHRQGRHPGPGPAPGGGPARDPEPHAPGEGAGGDPALPGARPRRGRSTAMRELDLHQRQRQRRVHHHRSTTATR